jgi:hypothetical protein
VGQQISSKATMGQVHGHDGSDGAGDSDKSSALHADAEKAPDAATRKAVAVTGAKEATTKEAMIAAVTKEPAAIVATKEAPDITLDPKATTEKTTTTAELSDARGSGLGAAQADATPDPKVGAKRTAATTGSGGSSSLNFFEDSHFSLNFLCGFTDPCFYSPWH